MKKRILSFKYAFNGIVNALKSEVNLRIHLVIACLVVIAGLFFRISHAEWFACLLCFSIVIPLELINTAIEHIVDLISPNHHPLAGKAKDVAAAAVLVSAIFSVIVGVLIFTPKILHFCFGSIMFKCS